MRASYDFVKLFAGYTFTNAKARYLPGNQILPLTPKSKINSALLFEKEENFKAGVEAYYTSSQFLTDRFRTRPYWVFGAFGEKTFGKYSLFINAENFTDTRQGRFGRSSSRRTEPDLRRNLHAHRRARLQRRGEGQILVPAGCAAKGKGAAFRRPPISAYGSVDCVD